MFTGKKETKTVDEKKNGEDREEHIVDGATRGISGSSMSGGNAFKFHYCNSGLKISPTSDFKFFTDLERNQGSMGGYLELMLESGYETLYFGGGKEENQNATLSPGAKKNPENDHEEGLSEPYLNPKISF